MRTYCTEHTKPGTDGLRDADIEKRNHASRAAAIDFARRRSDRLQDGVYVIVCENGQAIGHIAYHNGFRDHTEGDVAPDAQAA